MVLLPQVGDAEPGPSFVLRTLALDGFDPEVLAPFPSHGCAEDDILMLLSELYLRRSRRTNGGAVGPFGLRGGVRPAVDFHEGPPLQAGRVEKGTASGVGASDYAPAAAAIWVDGLVADAGRARGLFLKGKGGNG